MQKVSGPKPIANVPGPVEMVLPFQTFHFRRTDLLIKAQLRQIEREGRARHVTNQGVNRTGNHQQGAKSKQNAADEIIEHTEVLVRLQYGVNAGPTGRTAPGS